MKRSLLLIVGTIVALHGAYSQIRIMPLGNSITEGVLGSSDDTGYRRALHLSLTAAGFSIDFVGGRTNGFPLDFDRNHEGHSGWRADQIRDNISSWLTTNPADIILLHIGTNDISQGQTASSTVTEVSQILDGIDARSTAIVVVLARIINRNDARSATTTDYNTRLQVLADTRIANGDHIIVVDQEAALNYPSDLIDAVHPNDAGYAKMAQCWFAALSDYLRPESKSITQANTDVTFARSKATVNFSALPSGGGNVTITRHEQLPGSPPTFPDPPASSTYVPLWLEITSTMPQNSFVVQVTLDVTGTTGFSPMTRLVIHTAGAPTWVPMPGTYDADNHSFTFTARHLSEFAFVNPTGNAFALYVSASATDTQASVVYPNTTWGLPTAYDPDDWTWTGMQPVTVNLVPQPGSVFGMCDLTVEWDSTVMHLDTVDWGGTGNPNGLFAVGHSYPVMALSEQLGSTGKVVLNCSRLDDTNFTTVAGDYVAALVFTLLKPGYTPVSVVGSDVRAYVTGQAPAGVFMTPHIGQVKAYLGDVASSGGESVGDGKIDFEDLVLWSYSYWSGVPGYVPGMEHYKVKYDIGPTQNGLTTSLPVADGGIDFEDLVIFSLAYGESNTFRLPKQAAASGRGLTVATGTPRVCSSETRVPLLLSGDVRDVRALSIIASGSFGRFIGVEKGALLQEYSTPVLLMGNILNGRVCVDLAIAGLSAKALAAEGEVVILRFAGLASVEVSRVDARSSANTSLAIMVNPAEKEIPARFALDQNYPNPFNPTTTIAYALPHRSHVALAVYTSLGQQAATLINAEIDAGYHSVQFDAAGLASGVYFYRLQAGSFVDTKKLLLMR